jgi:hypothetical protein
MNTVVDTTEQSIQYWGGCQDALGYDTVWSMWEFNDINQNVLKPGSKRVCYTFYAETSTVEELMSGKAQRIEVSAIAASGKVRDLWTAAEICYQKAKLQGDWHKFIEDIELRDDGSWELTMGS